jgi:hypothetical protein
MSDLLFLTLIVLFFLVSLGLLWISQRLMR